MPFVGCILFLILYIVAALYYPGGTAFDKASKGFSWTQNYWCNLLNEEAINGQHNPARPIAMTAMVVLCVSMVIFWYLFPLQVRFGKSRRSIMQLSGFGAMTTSFFLFTSFHDIVIDVATILGLIAFGGTLAGLKKLQWKRLFRAGLFILVLIALNNLFYYNKSLQVYLPIVQKITFLYFLVWICFISIGLYNKTKIRKNIPA